MEYNFNKNMSNKPAGSNWRIGCATIVIFGMVGFIVGEKVGRGIADIDDFTNTGDPIVDELNELKQRGLLEDGFSTAGSILGIIATLATIETSKEGSPVKRDKEG